MKLEPPNGLKVPRADAICTHLTHQQSSLMSDIRDPCTTQHCCLEHDMGRQTSCHAAMWTELEFPLSSQALLTAHGISDSAAGLSEENRAPYPHRIDIREQTVATLSQHGHVSQRAPGPMAGVHVGQPPTCQGHPPFEP